MANLRRKILEISKKADECGSVHAYIHRKVIMTSIANVSEDLPMCQILLSQHAFIQSLKKCYKIMTIIIPILQIQKLRQSLEALSEDINLFTGRNFSSKGHVNRDSLLGRHSSFHYSPCRASLTNLDYHWALVVICITCSRFITWVRISHAHARSSRRFSSVQFSCSVVSESLRPHELHSRPPCPSPTPGVHPNPCPLSQGLRSKYSASGGWIYSIMHVSELEMKFICLAVNRTQHTPISDSTTNNFG